MFGVKWFLIFVASSVKWFVIFVNDCTRMTWLYLMKNKHEVLEYFNLFIIL